MSERDKVRDREATEWFGRMHGPGALTHRAAFDAWRSDPANRAAYEVLEQQFEEAAVLVGTRRADLRERTRYVQDPKVLYKLAGALAACVVAAALLVMIPWRGGVTETRYATTLGEIRTVSLADGSSLVLDTNSAVTATSHKGRQVVRLEQGRARIVARGPTRIETDASEVEAQDATVDLALAPQGRLTVTAVTGQVRLGGKAKLTPASAILPAGRQAVFGAQPAKFDIQPASKVEAQWPSGLRTFDQTPLSEVVAIANRYNSRKIRFAEPAIGTLRVSGAFRVTGAEDLANGLAAAFGLVVTRAPSGDFILSRNGV